MTKTIRELLKHIDSEELVLPEIQRDFVWARRSVLKLFDSLYRGMPIGHFLVWKAKRPVRTKAFEGKQAPGSVAEIESFYGYLLDGQQRLTSIARVRDRDDNYPLRFNLRPNGLDPADSRFEWHNGRNIKNPWFVSVADVLGRRIKTIQWIDDIRTREQIDSDEAERLQQDLTRLQGILDYHVGVTEYETDDYRDATELFIRFNGTGKRLSKNDLAMAELALSVPGLAAGPMADLRTKWRDFPFTASFLVQCLLVVHTSRLRLKDAQTAWGDEDERAVRDSWTKLQKAMEQLVPFLTGTVHWRKLSSLPSINALIPLVYVLAKGSKWTDADRTLGRRWLHLTTLNYTFSGSVHTTIDKMVKKISDAPSMKALWNATGKANLKRLNWETFDTSRLSGPTMALYLAWLAARDAKDWEKKEHRLDGSVVGSRASLQVHHFFPRALLRKHGWTDDWINYMPNYTVISADTNLGISTEEPTTYMERLDIPEEQLRLQCIPTDRELWRVAKYEEFCEARTKLLVSTLNEHLGA